MSSFTPVRWLPVRHRAAPPRRLLRFDPAEFAPRLETRLLILQSTPFCNIDCDYCYLPDRQQSARMAPDVIEDDLAGDEITVVWHAGEPMILPLDYYRRAVDIIDAQLGHRTRVTYSFQTNGTRITDDWCRFILERGIRIGISIDGPEEIHDSHRRTRDGRGTHARVLEGIGRLDAHGIDYHAIAVVTSTTLDRAEAFAAFFEQHAFTEVGCNFDEAEGENARSSLEHEEAAHARLLELLLDRSLAATRPVRFRELARALHAIATDAPRYTWRGHRWPDNSQVLPFALLSVAHDGSFSTFSPELLGQPHPRNEAACFANVLEKGYLAAADGEAFQTFWTDVVEGVVACEHGCAHFSYCGGGAPANKLFELGTPAGTETLYCRSMVKRPFDLVLAKMETSLDRGNGINATRLA